MIKNYCKTALRKLRRNRSYAGINMLGLALGMTCCLLIFLIIQYELRFDRFHSKRDRIEIGANTFALALMFTLMIAALTTGFRALKAAAANPVEALRYE